MRFQSPNMLLFILLTPVLWMLWIFTENASKNALAKFLSPEMFVRLRVHYSERRKKYRFICLLLALNLAAVALARPQLGTKEETVNTQGLDIVFMLDVSNSMLAEDIAPSRLKKAKHVIRNFLDRLSGDRAGIVGFAGSAYQAAPMTSDYEFLKQVLDIMDEKSIQNQGTNLSKALQVAYDLLKRGGLNQDVVDTSKEEAAGSMKASKVLIILSDGEDNVGEESKIAGELARQGVKVYSIGVGSFKGSPIPMRDQNGGMSGFLKDKKGNIVLTKLESKSLESMAENGDGRYFSASSDEGEIQEIMGELTGLERSEGEGRKIITYDEYFQIPLGFSLLFLFIMIGTPLAGSKKYKSENIIKENTSSGLTSLVLIVLMLSSERLLASSYKEYSETKEGVKAYESKDYAESIRRFGNAQADNPDLKKHRMNMGAALYKSGSLEGAAKEFNSVLKESKDPSEAAKGAYNLGKTFDANKDHDKAIESYQQGLNKLLASVDKGEEVDPEVVEKLKRALQISEQKKQQQKQQQEQDQKDKKDGGDKKDQQKKENDDDQKDKNEKNDDQKQSQQLRNPKPKFKEEKLSEGDAKRLLKQLQEGEKKTQARLMQKKSAKTGGKAKDIPTDKNW